MKLDAKFNAGDLEIGQEFLGKHPVDGTTPVVFTLIRLTAIPSPSGSRCSGSRLIMVLRFGDTKHEVIIPHSTVKQGQFWTQKFLPKHIACRPKRPEGYAMTAREALVI